MLRSALLLAALAAPTFAAQPDPTAKYIQKGKLTAAVEVAEIQSGFAGFSGTYYSVAPDGSWSVGEVGPNNKKEKATATGKLTTAHLMELAEALAKHDLAALPAHGVPEVNPAVVRVRFGTRAVELQPGRGKAPADKDAKVRDRYEGIAEAVKKACQAPQEDRPNDKK